MKTQKRIHLATVFISLFLCGSLVFYGFQAIGEEWTAEQKEVWKVVEADIEFFKQGDLEGLSASRHDDAVLWWSNSASPFDKRWSMMYYKDWFDNDRPVNFESEPLAIKIIGNVAIVFYTSKFSGKIFSGRTRTMDTWIKQNNKWQKIGSFDASCDKLPPCN